MRFTSSWLRNWKRSAPAARRGTPTSRRRRAGYCPPLEALEGRRLLSTLTVTSAGDSGAGSLRAAIDAAQSGDTIVFAPTLSYPKKKGNQTASTTPGTITLTSGQLLLTKNLTIQGPGTAQLAISGNAGSPPIRRGNTLIPTSSRVFEIAPNATVTLTGLTITKGYGSGMLNQGTLTVTGCTISAGSSGAGGGISNRGGTLTVSGCTVSGNSALYEGGGIWNGGGTVTISNCTFSGNASRFGGGIFNAGGAVTISNSTLSANRAFHADYPWSGGDGGGIYNSSGTLTLSNSILSGNTADPFFGSGGGIYNGSGGAVTVQNSSNITGNSCGVLGADVYNVGVLYRDGSSTIGILDGHPAILN